MMTMASESSTTLERGTRVGDVNFEYFGHLTCILYFFSYNVISISPVDISNWG